MLQFNTHSYLQIYALNMTDNSPKPFTANLKFVSFVMGITFLSLAAFSIYELYGLSYKTALELAEDPELVFSLLAGSVFLCLSVVLHLKSRN